MDKAKYQVTINGLIYNKENKLLLLKCIHDSWDLPGGRLEYGETFQECFKRECREEIGVNGELLSDIPTHVWTGKDFRGRWRLMLCFEANVDSFDFIQSDECIDHAFLSKNELKKIDLRPQTKKLLDYS